MKRKLLITIAIIVMLFAGVGIVWLGNEKELTQRDSCLSILRSTGAAIGQYCNDW